MVTADITGYITWGLPALGTIKNKSSKFLQGNDGTSHIHAAIFMPLSRRHMFEAKYNDSTLLKSSYVSALPAETLSKD